MEEKKQIDACIEPLRKIITLNSELDDLIRERQEKEAEFKAYLREQDKAINALTEQKQIIGQTVIDIDVKNSGHLRAVIKNCLELSGIQLMGNKVVSDKGGIHTEMYKGFVSGDSKEISTKVVYGETVDEVLDSAGMLTNKDAYTTVNIGTLNPLKGEYGDYHKFDIAKRYDITDVQLSLPYMDKNEFSELIGHLKAEGAKFNSYVKKWYIPYDISEKECFQPYITELPRQRDYSRQRHYTSQELSLPVGITGKTVNDMLARYDGYIRITYEDNGRGRIAPRAEFYQNGAGEESAYVGKWLTESRVRALVVEGREMNKDILYPGKGYRITPEEDTPKTTPYAAIVREKDIAGEYYSIYGVHDLSGMIFRLSPRRFDTQGQAEDNIPVGHKCVLFEKLKNEQKLYADAWSQLIRDDAKNCGYELSEYAIKNLKLLNYETNKSWGLEDISKIYSRMNDEKQPEELSERACAYIKRIGDECANMQRLERMP